MASESAASGGVTLTKHESMLERKARRQESVRQEYGDQYGRVDVRGPGGRNAPIRTPGQEFELSMLDGDVDV